MYNDTCEAAISNQKSKLVGTDKFAHIDIQLLKELMGENGGGVKRLQTLVLEKCIPTAGVPIELETACTELQKIVSSNLFNVLQKGPQNVINTVMEWVSALKKNEKPAAMWKAGEFLTEVWSRLPMFFSTTSHVKGEDDKEELVRTYGVPALAMAWASVQKKEAKDIEVHQIELLAAFASWLSPAVATEVAKKKTAVLKAKLSKGAKSATTETKGTKPKKQTADERALEMAKKFVKKRKTD
eukprot:881068-Amphidinium_carterae.2